MKKWQVSTVKKSRDRSMDHRSMNCGPCRNAWEPESFSSTHHEAVEKKEWENENGCWRENSVAVQRRQNLSRSEQAADAAETQPELQLRRKITMWQLSTDFCKGARRKMKHLSESSQTKQNKRKLNDDEIYWQCERKKQEACPKQKCFNKISYFLMFSMRKQCGQNGVAKCTCQNCYKDVCHLQAKIKKTRKSQVQCRLTDDDVANSKTWGKESSCKAEWQRSFTKQQNLLSLHKSKTVLHQLHSTIILF